MTCRQSRFYTLDMTGFSLRFINFKFSRFVFITEILYTMVTFKHTYFLFRILKQ